MTRIAQALLAFAFASLEDTDCLFAPYIPLTYDPIKGKSRKWNTRRTNTRYEMWKRKLRKHEIN